MSRRGLGASQRPRHLGEIARLRLLSVLAFVASILLVAACSGERDAVAPHDFDDAAATSGIGADPFVGMWDFDHGSPQTAPFSSGMLMIDDPCLYIIHLANPFFAHPTDGLDPYLVPLTSKLLYGLARHPDLDYDAKTRQISYLGDTTGPMSTGDYVSFAPMGTSASSPEAAAQCSSTTIRPVTGISPLHYPEWLQEQLHVPLGVSDDKSKWLHGDDASRTNETSDPFLGMWDHGPKEADFSIGMLMVDEPCAYLVSGRWDNYINESGDEWALGIIPHKYVLALPRAHIRFDRGTGEIWYKDRGPMRTGDIITFAGTPRTEATPEEARRCRTTARIQATELDPWVPPDWMRDDLKPD